MNEKRINILSKQIPAFLAVMYFFAGCSGDISTPPGLGPKWILFGQNNNHFHSNNITCLHTNQREETWIGTDSGAVMYYHGGWGVYRDSLNFIEYIRTDTGEVPVVACNVSTIAEGKDGSIWFGMNGGGAIRYNRLSKTIEWQKYLYPDIQQNNINALATETIASSDVWVGTILGVSRFVPIPNAQDGGIWHQYTHATGARIPSEPSISSIAVDYNDNTIWFGSYGDSLVSYDGSQTWESYPIPFSIKSPKVTSIDFDLDGHVWVSQQSAVSELDPIHSNWLNIYTASNTNGFIPYDGANVVITDKHKIRWFGTNNGLVELNDTTWSKFDMKNSPLPSLQINALAYDALGNLWIGTNNGLAIYNPKGTQLQ